MQPSRKLSLLESPLFIASLLLLGANDLLFKQIEINWFTGKLSDFAGLSSLLLFLIAFFPKRAKELAYSLAASWIVWKLPLSRGLLSVVNDSIGSGYGRVEDLTDLLALSVIPYTYSYATRYRIRTTQVTLQHGAIILTSIFLFAGTGRIKHDARAEYRIDYIYDMDVFELRDLVANSARTFRADPGEPGRAIATVSAARRDSMARETVEADIILGQTEGHSRLRLERLTAFFPIAQEGMLPYFESNLINRLPRYTSRQERIFFTDKHGAPAGPIFLLFLSLWPLVFALRRRSKLWEAWRNQEKKTLIEVVQALQFLMAFLLMGLALYWFIDAFYVGGPYFTW